MKKITINLLLTVIIVLLPIYILFGQSNPCDSAKPLTIKSINLSTSDIYEGDIIAFRADVEGGVNPYRGVSKKVQILSSGTYCMDISDKCKQSASKCINVVAKANPCGNISTLSLSGVSMSPSNPQCGETFTLSGSASGGHGNYSYSGQTQTASSNSSDYCLTVEDGCGHKKTACISFDCSGTGGGGGGQTACPSVDLVLSPVTTDNYNPECGQTINLYGTATGGTPPYMYFHTSYTVTAGQQSYCMLVMDQHGCVDAGCVDIYCTPSGCDDAQPLSLSNFSVDNPNPTCGDAITLSGTATGGIGPYSYANQTYIVSSNQAQYCLTVSDACNNLASECIDIQCEVDCSKKTKPLSMFIISTNAGDGNCDDDIEFYVKASGGAGQYSYTGLTQTLVSGQTQYCVTVQDECQNVVTQCISFSCILDDSCENLPPLQIQTLDYSASSRIAFANLLLNCGTTIVLNPTVTGGDGNYSYSNTHFTVTQGQTQYCVTVTDGCGNSTEKCITILCNGSSSCDNLPDLTLENISASPSKPECGETITLSATPGGGDGNYTFSQVTHIVTSDEKTYCLIVEDGCGNGVKNCVKIDCREKPGGFGGYYPLTVNLKSNSLETSQNSSSNIEKRSKEKFNPFSQKLSITPNPIIGDFIIIDGINDESASKVELFDIVTGQLIGLFDIHVENHKTRLELPLDLSNGFYGIRINSEKRQIGKFIKID